jgi:hypothetical protein
MRNHITRTLSTLAARLVNGLVSRVDDAASMFGLGTIHSWIRRAHPRQHEFAGSRQLPRFRHEAEPPAPSWRYPSGLKPLGRLVGLVPVVAHGSVACRVPGQGTGRPGLGLG